MTIAFSTDQLAQRDRIPFWVDVASKIFYGHGFKTDRELDFSARLDTQRLDSLGVTRCGCGPCEVTRTSRDVARDGVDDLILTIRLTGRSLFSQGDRKFVIEPGTVILQDAGRPLKLTLPEPMTSLCVSIPRKEVQARISDSDIERTLSTGLPMVGIASEFVHALAARLHAIEPSTHRRLADQLLDLITLAFSGSDETSISSTRSSVLRRLKREIEKRLSDPSLTPSDVAAGAGISVRYANLLLAEEGFSLERYIVHRRLQQCRRALEDPLQGHRMIGEIAFAWGFSDHSHFTRRFRAAFGMTPGDCRAAAMSGVKRRSGVPKEPERSAKSVTLP